MPRATSSSYGLTSQRTSHLAARAQATFARYRSWCGPEGRDFVSAGAVADLEHCAVKLFGKTHDIRSQKTGFKLKRASLLSKLVNYKAGRGHPNDHEGNFAVFLAVTRVIKVGELGLGPQGLRLCPVTCAYSSIAASTSRNVLTA